MQSPTQSRAPLSLRLPLEALPTLLRPRAREMPASPPHWTSSSPCTDADGRTPPRQASPAPPSAACPSETDPPERQIAFESLLGTETEAPLYNATSPLLHLLSASRTVHALRLEGPCCGEAGPIPEALSEDTLHKSSPSTLRRGEGPTLLRNRLPDGSHQDKPMWGPPCLLEGSVQPWEAALAPVHSLVLICWHRASTNQPPRPSEGHPVGTPRGGRGRDQKGCLGPG
ncbi:hypothetical protein H8959_018160 [Pygathrix nigripes]